MCEERERGGIMKGGWVLYERSFWRHRLPIRIENERKQPTHHKNSIPSPNLETTPAHRRT